MTDYLGLIITAIFALLGAAIGSLWLLAAAIIWVAIGFKVVIDVDKWRR